MERAAAFGQSLSNSFSLPSLVEGSEPISEADEFVEMRSLREHGDKALEIRDFTGAIKYYNEALEIDAQNAEVLLARAEASIEMGDYIGAEKDVEVLINRQPDNHKAFKVKGLALQHLHQYKEALTAYLVSMELNPDNSDELTDLIADVAAQFCHMSMETRDSLNDMDSYKKLSEVGVCLFQSKKYKMCIKILEAAQKFQTNQKGITMRILLTSANAHSALKHTDQAIGLYQECLSTAIATHDQIYQTKALVNIATLYLENHDTHQAISYYEKLLHLEAELVAETGSEDNLPDFWTKELQCGLHLNLSIAYKAIGGMREAIKHAQRYVCYIEKYQFVGKLKAESYHNTGMLNEILGNFNEAINNYSKYLQECKGNKDKKGMAQAYGCLGSVYAALRNWKLSLTYHEQYVTMAKKFDDSRINIIANEMLGDTLMLKGDYEEAVKAYEAMLNNCTRTDYRSKATCFCKLGHSYRALQKNQYSLYFYEQAAEIGEDFDIPEIITLSHYNIACINQQSSQLLELEEAFKYFQQLLPYFESKIQEHAAEDSHCPEEYHVQLRECYDGMQTVLAKLGNKDECLQYAEAYRKRSLTQTHNYQASALNSQSHTAPWDMWTIEKINRIVTQQNSTVLYYSLLSEYLLLWVLQPGTGLVRFYSKKAAANQNMIHLIDGLIGEIRAGLDARSLQNETENRALPQRFSSLEMLRQKNLRLGKTEKDPSAGQTGVPPTAETSKLAEEIKPEKNCMRRLYDLLFSPVEDILCQLSKESPLTIIPDKSLHHCPFSVLEDFLHRHAYQRFCITYLPSLLLLDKVVANEMNHLRALDELRFERQKNKKGGVGRYKLSTADTRNVSVNSGYSDLGMNPKRQSHPRLLTCPTRTPMAPPHPGMLPKQATMFEEDFKQHSLWKSPSTPRGKKVTLSPVETPRSAGTPSPLEKMVSLQTYTTLTTETSTGTDITQSHNSVPQFRQVSCQDKCMVIGNPQLPDSLMLYGRCWRPGLVQMTSAKREITHVAELLDVSPVTGAEASKQHFLESVQQATVLHIVTYGSWQEGLLVMCPSPVDDSDQPPNEESYIVSADDILSLRLTAQLVVLSTGYTNFHSDTLPAGYLLPSAFLAAGAQSVHVSLWPLPDLAMEKYYHHFYMALQAGSMVTMAARTALEAVREDDRYKLPVYWSGFIVIGKDVRVQLTEIRHAMLDQIVDAAEVQLETETGEKYLNPKPALAPVKKKEDLLHDLQRCLCLLLRNHAKQPSVIKELIDMMDSALKRLHTSDNNKKTTILSDELIHCEGALQLLKIIGFHFQASGTSLDNPYVVYPHWNKDELLIPTYDSLRAILDLSSNLTLVQALCSVLPISQSNVSLLVDLLSVTKHAPEIQLKVSDLSVRSLWLNMKLKAVLVAAGFHQIGMLLDFTRTPHNRQVMMALFQLLLAISQHKSQVLMYRLDVDLLGTGSEAKSTEMDFPVLTKLPSLAPLILPRNQLRMSTPWLSKSESQTEMEEKIRLARSRTTVDDSFHGYMERARTWHQMTVTAQANETLGSLARPVTQPQKVKVKPGGSASTARVPLDFKPSLTNPEVDERRDYAHYIYQERLANINHRHKNEVLKLYLPYVNAV